MARTQSRRARLRPRRRRACFFVLNAGVSGSSCGQGIDRPSLTTFRTTGSALLFVLFAVVADRSALRLAEDASSPSCCCRRRRDRERAVDDNIAIDRIPAAWPLLLEYLAPVLVVIWARFVQRQHVRRTMWLAVALTLVGLALVAQIASGLAFLGLGMLAGLAAAACLATYFLVGEQGVSEADPIRVVVWAFVFAAIAMNVVRPIWTSPDLDGSANLRRARRYESAVARDRRVASRHPKPFFMELSGAALPATGVTMVANSSRVGARTRVGRGSARRSTSRWRGLLWSREVSAGVQEPYRHMRGPRWG